MKVADTITQNKNIQYVTIPPNHVPHRNSTTYLEGDVDLSDFIPSHLASVDD